jgi:hypothetical protein
MIPVKREDGWWITEIGDNVECGPYDTASDAEDDMLGLIRYAKYGHIPGYVRSEESRSDCRKSNVASSNGSEDEKS